MHKKTLSHFEWAKQSLVSLERAAHLFIQFILMRVSAAKFGGGDFRYFGAYLCMLGCCLLLLNSVCGKIEWRHLIAQVWSAPPENPPPHPPPFLSLQHKILPNAAFICKRQNLKKSQSKFRNWVQKEISFQRVHAIPENIKTFVDRRWQNKHERDIFKVQC